MSRASAGAVVPSFFRSVLRRRNLRRMRRLGAAFMAVLTALGVGLQQTQADFFIMHRIVHGPMPARQYIPVDGEWTDYAAEWGKRFVKSFTNWADRRFSSSTPPDPAAVTGAPWPWQAYDPVGPWSVVNLANGNLHTVIPIAAWPGVQFNLYHNSLGTHELASLGGRGWLHSYSAHLDIDGNDVIYIADDGREVPFTLSSGEGENDVYRMKIELVDDDPDYYVLTDAGQNTMTFNLSGVLQELADASGNTTTLTYDTGLLSTITDEVGRAITLTYDGESPKRLIMIEIPPMLNRSEEDSGGEDDDIERIAELTYGSQSSDDFLQRVYSMRRETCLKEENVYPLFWVEIEYEATSSRIEWITDYGDGGSDGTNDHHTWNFDYYNSGGGHRFQEVTNPLVYDFDADDDIPTTRAYAYGTPGGGEVTRTVTDERENEWIYTFDDPAGRLLSLEDPLSRMLAQLTWTDLNRPASITNVLGGETTFDYTFNMDGSETIEVLGPQNEDPVIIDIDELNRLTQITDPLEQVTTFAYDDTENPTRMTEMAGPGDANTANFCWTRLDNGKLDPDPLGGLPKATASPTNTTQGFFYDGFGNLRGWEQPANTEEGVCSNIPLREIGGGEDNSACCNDSRAYLHNSTGERLASGASSGGCCDSGYDPNTGCPRKSGDCSVNGCGHGRDAAGNPNRSFCTYSGCEFNPPGSSPLPNGGEEDTTCDSAFLTNPPIVHDANNRLVSVSAGAGGSRQQIGYELAYDARGRLSSYDVEAPNDFDDYYNGANDFHLAPNYSTLSEYSDTTGGFRETYTRINDDEATERTITTTYETDAAGRITSVSRYDGVATVETLYTYSDNGSPSVANITVIHDDGARSLYYLNDAGELCKIVHMRPVGVGGGDSPPIVVASFEVITWDDNRRITEIEENFLDPGASDDYRTERVTFTYGDGDLDAGHLDADSATEVEHDKVYWDFLADLNSELPLASSDPNRLVREHRTLIDEGYSGYDAVTYDKRYFYDPNGNRLAAVEVDPGDEEVLRSVARYNYAYEGVLDGDGEERPPGVPDVVGGTQWMDYAAHGRDQLMSTQTLYFEGDENNTLDRVAVETFTYGGSSVGNAAVHMHMLSRQRTTYRWDAKLGKGGRWWTQVVEETDYEYDSGTNAEKLQKQEYAYTVYDVPEEEEPLGDVLHEGAIGEFSGYDELLGRRIATWRCEAVDSTQIDWGPTGVCKAKSVMHDYYGLSQRVAATRLSPWRYNGLSYDNVGDEFHESYTYGPVGVTARTVETEDTDPEDNFDHWVLPDLFGGTSALLLYDAQPHERALATEHFDAFGVRVAKGTGWGLSLDASRYRWRSQEGSETDDLHRNDPDEGVFLSPPTLVYMQTRHYDPGLGRFIMADSIPMGAFSPQGLNRYAYCTNDPVNGADPSGLLKFTGSSIDPFWIAFTAGGILGAAYASAVLDGPNHPWLARAAKFLLGMATQAGGRALTNCAIKNAYKPIGWEVMHGVKPPTMHPAVPAIGFVAGYLHGMLAYTLWTLFEDASGF